jgi:RND family efflux transporter MFP subunit
VSAAGQNADYTTVRAPYAGIVAARRVEPGETVGPGQPLLSLYAPDDLRIEVRVPQSAADAIRAKPQARVVFDDGRSVEAREVVVYPAADPASHSVPVRVALPRIEARAPAPGATAKVVFPIAGGDGGVRIPDGAVVRRSELTAVYVVKDGRVLLRQVRLGARHGDAVDVLAGLIPGDVVARDPGEALRALAAARATQGAVHG